MKNKNKLYWIFALAGVILVITASYVSWNHLDPNYTCAQCHEIRSACQQWEQSFHANVTCIECHGTALESWTSTMEKMNMVITHFTRKKTFEDISLNEERSLAIVNKCATCHQAEHAAWRASAHSANYNDIFMNLEHNQMERPYWDCFRCHGMFYNGDIDDLMDLQRDKPEEWYMKDKKASERPTITCIACHQSHHKQAKYADYQELPETTRENLAEAERTPPTAIYMRADKRHLPSVDLLKIGMYEGDSLQQVVTDPNTLLCMQCHSPNIFHQLGSEDDKTPIGKYEGMSCVTCHDPHSNQLKTSYRDVHKKESISTGRWPVLMP